MKISRARPHAKLSAELSAGIRRAVIYQVAVYTGFEIIFVLGALSAQRLTGADRVYGLSPVTPFALGQILVALPAGRWMDRWGRRSILMGGAILEALALALLGVALILNQPALFMLGLFLLGLGSGIGQLVFLIGGDLYAPRHRAEGLGIMTAYASLGVIVGPYIVGFVSDASEWLGLDPVVWPWFVASAIVALGAWAMAGLRPEPLEVSRHPERYYGEAPSSPRSKEPSRASMARGPLELVRLYPVAAAIGTILCFQGVRMSIVPLLTLILRQRGYSVTAGATMVAAMGFGMILGSYPSGRLGDRWGRRRLLFLSLLVGLVCSLLASLTTGLWLMFIALLFLGVSFVAVLNMARAILTDVALPEERGTAMGMSSTAVGVAVIVFPTLSSYVLSAWGWTAIAYLSAALLSTALVLTGFLRERGVGRWDHRGVGDTDGMALLDVPTDPVEEGLR